MSADFLAKIATEKRQALKTRAAYYENLKKNLGPGSHRRYQIFKQAISRPGKVNLIAEVKKASPSAGLIREDFDAVRIAKIYAQHKAAAISVLTEEKYFLGKPAYLKNIGRETGLPTLMKDFIVHEYQIYEGAFCGASAVLLIAAMLSDTQIKDFTAVAHGLGMDCLTEAHNEADMDRAIKTGAEIIGINNRDLQSLEVDVHHCLRLIPRVPPGKVIVAESGLQSHEDVQRVQEAGAHAVLIGEVFMRAADMGATIKEIMDG